MDLAQQVADISATSPGKLEQTRLGSGFAGDPEEVKSGPQAREYRPSGAPKAAGRLAGVRVISSAVALGGLAGGFKDQAGQVEGDGERVADDHGFGSVIQAEGAGALELPARLDGVAAFGVRLPADAEFPGFGAELGIAGQTGGAIRQVQASGDGISQGMLGAGKGASGSREVGGSAGDIRFRLVNALLAANPFCRLALVVVAVAGKAVAVWAEQDAIFIKAAFQASSGIVILPGMAGADSAQGVEFFVGKFQDFWAAFSSVAE